MIYHAKLTFDEVEELHKQILLHRGDHEEHTYKIGNIQVTGIVVKYTYKWSHNVESKYIYDIEIDIERLE